VRPTVRKLFDEELFDFTYPGAENRTTEMTIMGIGDKFRKRKREGKLPA